MLGNDIASVVTEMRENVDMTRSSTFTELFEKLKIRKRKSLQCLADTRHVRRSRTGAERWPMRPQLLQNATAEKAAFAAECQTLPPPTQRCS